MSSLRVLAQSLGLSITTVSRALDGYGDVAEATRERVRAAAETAGYRPNSAARRLRRGSTEIVTLVLPAEPGHFNEPLYIELLRSTGAALAEHGYDLTLIAALPGPDELKTYRRLVDGRRSDAIIVVRTRREDARLRYLTDAGFPFVAMGRSDFAEPYAFIDGDGEAAFHDAVLRLAGLGHRAIGHLAAPSAFTFAHLRRLGFERGCREAELAGAIVEDVASEAGGYRAAQELLARATPPTALLCATDAMALGALRAIRERGLAAGRDIALIGHDNIPAAAFADPALATMELPIVATGRRLAEMALARIGGADPRDLTEINPVEFVARASLGEARR
jgi:LacI family transcriptional regulator